MLAAWLPVIIGAIIVIFVLILLISGYVKASPDKAFIISGLRKTPKILIGKAGVKVPFLERKDELSLQLIPIDVKTASSVPTADYININVDAAVNIKISDKPDKLKLAAQNFLNKRPDYIAQVAREVLEGNMREIVGKMKLEEMVSDRQKFANLVKENADPDLGEMGLDIISFNVQNFVDDSGVIENLGVDNIVKIQKSAAIARAESEKEIAVAQAIAGKEANDAKVAAETAIAERNNELEIKKAELKIISDSKKADADAAYKIQEQERRKTIEATTGDADVVKQEKEVILQQRKVELETQKLDAEIKKKAEAEKFKREQEAQAELFERQRKAEAEMFEREKDAQAKKVQAEADLYAKEQEAKGIQAVGTAEAKAIEAKGIAEAEALEKKAEAMTKYGKAAMLEMIVTALPEMARAIAEPLSTIDKVTIIDSGSGESGVSTMGNYVPSVLAKTMESVKEITGLDLVDVMRAETYDAKVNHNVNVTGLDTPETAVSSKEVSGAVSKEVSKAVKSAVKEAIADVTPEA